MSTKLRTSTQIGFIGYIGGAGAIANFIHQHMPVLTGESYTFDHGANLANAAIVLVSAVAILTAKALGDLEHTVGEKTTKITK